MSEMEYSRSEVSAMITLASFCALSLTTVLIVLCVFAAAGLRRLNAENKNMYPMTHLALFFGSLLFSNVLQGVGNVMDVRWAIQAGVREGGYCTAQGAIKQVSNLGMSFWSLVIAFHAFTILFLRWKPKKWTAYTTFFLVWTFIILLVGAIPFAIKKPGIPYFGLAGYWCWIKQDYAVARIVLEYLWMYISIGVSAMLYALIFLRLRGNLLVEGRKWSLRLVPSSEAWQLQMGRDLVDAHMLKVASHMLLYPLAFVILILPITVIRMMENMGKTARFEVIIFAAIFFGLNGFVNTILLVSGRNLLPEDGSLPTVTMKRTISPVQSLSKDGGIVPFMLPPQAEPQTQERRMPTDLTRVRGLHSSNRSVDSATSHLGGMYSGGEELHASASVRSVDSTSRLVEPARDRLPQ